MDAGTWIGAAIAATYGIAIAWGLWHYRGRDLHHALPVFRLPDGRLISGLRRAPRWRSEWYALIDEDWTRIFDVRDADLASAELVEDATMSPFR